MVFCVVLYNYWWEGKALDKKHQPRIYHLTKGNHVSCVLSIFLP